MTTKEHWRAEEGELYYYLSAELKVAIDKDYDTESDLECYDVGNYFRTREDAIKARKLLKETLTKFHEENE